MGSAIDLIARFIDRLPTGFDDTDPPRVSNRIVHLLKTQGCLSEQVMSSNSSTAHIFLSYAVPDQSYADQFRALTAPHNVRLSGSHDIAAEANIADDVREALASCDIVVVLIGPTTQHSRWVDMEMELAIAPRSNGPTAGLLGIILPEHPDFAKPYYDPKNVPPRLHDRVHWEYGLIRKWTEDFDLVLQWLKEADRRRRQYRPAVNYSAIQALQRREWDDSADSPREFLKALREDRL